MQTLRLYAVMGRPRHQRLLTASDTIAVTLIVVAFFGAGNSAGAQTQDDISAALSVQGGASWRPVDDTYVGSPYLDKGLGGLGPAVGVGAHVSMQRVVFAFEYGFAKSDVMQTGRLVSGNAQGQSREHLLSFLAGGAAWSSPAASVQVLVGVTLQMSQPMQNGTPIDSWDDPAAVEGRGRVGFTLGADYVKLLERRVDVVGSVRHSLLPRSRRAEELGVGVQLFRFTAGVAVRLTG